jgi:catechol 2,3-dioxygenase-like lactoylglutathione lyase family enzyme
MLKDAKVATRLPAKDLNRARAFYSEKLGLDPVEEREGGLRYIFAAGEFAIFLSMGVQSGTHTQMGWEVDDIERTVRELRARGVEFEEYDLPGLRTVDGIAEIRGNYPSKGIGERGAWFRDSEGNLLGIAAPVRALDLVRPRRINYVLSVSMRSSCAANPEGDSDAHSGLGDFGDRDGLNRAGGGPDVRSGLPGLSAQVRTGGGSTITIAATRRCLSATRRHRAARQSASSIHISRARKSPGNDIIGGILASTKFSVRIFTNLDPDRTFGLPPHTGYCLYLTLVS